MMSMYKLVLILGLLSISIGIKSQANPEFKAMKDNFKQRRMQLEEEVNKRTSLFSKVGLSSIVEEQKNILLKKMDSVENIALIGVLVKVKNLEDLSRIQLSKEREDVQKPLGDERPAEYPGGIPGLRDFINKEIYVEGLDFQGQEILMSNVRFAIEPDGTVSTVKATGKNHSLNVQSEIVVYLLPDRFLPGLSNGIPVRSFYSVPIHIVRSK